MKKYFSFSVLMVALAALCIGFNSCDKDNDGDESGGSPVGEWTYEKTTADIKHSDSELVTEEQGEVKDRFTLDEDVTIEFKADSTFLWMNEGEYSGSWSADGKLTFDDEEEDVPQITFSIKNDELILAFSMLDQKYNTGDETSYREDGFTEYTIKYSFKKANTN
ncbi:MAG: hypothetical protein LBE71_03885 [Dysgonamonadaceae bacterium]|jgi:hypothetical protein|nr:hypothetical protein [Dysgonamonadaceae bacterium]